LQCDAVQIALVIWAFFASPQFGQISENAVTLRSNTRLVQLDVIAVDKKGHPVDNLARDNFEIYDEGKLQQIRIFTRDSLQGGLSSTPVSLGRNGPGIVFENMAEARSGPAAVTIVLIDSLNTKWINQAYARQQIVRFLRQIRPDDHIAIYSMGFGGFRVLHDFTQDASDLVTKLASWTGEVKAQATSEDSSTRPDMGQQLGDWLNGKSPDFVQSQMMGDSSHSATVQSLRTLTAIANQLASIPGRKNLIWISEGFPLVNWGTIISAVYGPTDIAAKMSRRKTSTQSEDARSSAEPASYYAELSSALRAINDDNVVIYPVDAMGLDNPAYNADKAFPSSMSTLDFQQVHARQNVMEDIAKRTGGKAFYETNDLQHAIRMAMNDSKMTYTLGFYPESAEFRGKFHALKVRVVGRSDVRLHYRQGYFDSPEPPRDESQRRLRLENAAWSPLDANAIALSARIEPTQAAGSTNVTGRLRLKINSSDLRFTESGMVHVAEADVFVVQKDDSGKQLDAIEQVVRVEVNPNGYAEVARTGILFTRDFNLNSNTSVLRIVVGDAHSDRLGSVTIRRVDLVH
jgi:VWFA-related protein